MVVFCSTGVRVSDEFLVYDGGCQSIRRFYFIFNLCRVLSGSFDTGQI